jgi:YtcA family
MTESFLLKAPLLAVTSCLLTGCSFGEAPSFELFGAFFPAWLLCGVIGIVGAAGTRVVLTTATLGDVIPFQLAVCTAVGVIVALFSWMALFG